LSEGPTGDRQRRVRRGAIALGIVAVAVYVGFIVISLTRGAS